MFMTNDDVYCIVFTLHCLQYCIITTHQHTEFVKSVTEYNLSKSELVQLINTRPTTHVELHAIIEECEDRYSENQV